MAKIGEDVEAPKSDAAPRKGGFLTEWVVPVALRPAPGRLEEHAGKPVVVHVRTGDEMAAVARDNPFPDDPRNTTVATTSISVPCPR